MTDRREAKQRRLAAVVFTDIVGYSALVNRDEALGEKLLNRHRRVIRGLLPRFAGREIETAGDSFLLEFGSALAALRCVVAIHHALAADALQHAEDPPVQVRASIHVGDIEHRGRQVYGDGVNVSARLMPLAPPGGVALSDQAYAQVRHRVEIEPHAMGPQELKNIRYPVPVLSFDAAQVATIQLEARSGPEDRRQHPRWSAPRIAGVLAVAGIVVAVILGYAVSRLPHREDAARGADRRTIAVLPFSTFSKGEGDDLLGNGIQDSVLTDLARVQALRVISRTSVAGFKDFAGRSLKDIAAQLGVGAVLEGSVQRQGDRILVQAQLIDANTDQHLWAQAYDRRIDDLFAAESDIAQQVAEAVQVKLSADERSAIERKPTVNAEAYGEYVKAQQLMDDSVTQPSLDEAQQHLDRALKLDPDFALAHMAYSRQHLYRYYINLDRTDERLALAKNELMTAQQLQPALAELHIGWGRYYFIGRNEMDTAEAEFRTALQSLPNSVEANSALGTILENRGTLREALVYQRRALELSPRSSGQYVKLLKTMLLLRDYRSAAHVLDRAERILPDVQQIKQMRLVLDFLLGDMARAKADAVAVNDPHLLERIAYFSGDFDEAIRQATAQPEWQSDGTGSDAYPREVTIGYFLWLKGDQANSEQHLKNGARMLEQALAKPGDAQTGQKLSLALAYALLREPVRTRALLEQVHATQDYLNPELRSDILASEAVVYVVLGDQQAAISTLRELLEKPAIYSSNYLRLDPAFKALHGNTAFQKLLSEAQARESSEA